MLKHLNNFYIKFCFWVLMNAKILYFMMNERTIIEKVVSNSEVHLISSLRNRIQCILRSLLNTNYYCNALIQITTRAIRWQYLLDFNEICENRTDMNRSLIKKIFVYVFIGIPSVLNYIDMNQTPSGSPALIPYPSLANNVAGDCANGLSTVYRLKGKKYS